jgi:hypothetical protein
MGISRHVQDIIVTMHGITTFPVTIDNWSEPQILFYIMVVGVQARIFFVPALVAYKCLRSE